jgi:hypothetical protein
MANGNDGGSNLRMRVEGICEILKGWQHCFYRSERLKLSWSIHVVGRIQQWWEAWLHHY